MAIHFKTSKDRLDYLKGKHQEIIPVEVEPVEVVEEKPKKESAPKKKAEKKDGKVSSK